jgi:hypothetical protein
MKPTSQCSQSISFATLSAWHDGFLASPQAEQIAFHVPKCLACQSILAEFTDITQRLNTIGEPAALHTKLRQTFWSNLHPTPTLQGAPHMSQVTTIRRSATAVVVALSLIAVFALTFHLFSLHSTSLNVGGHLTPTVTPQSPLLPPSDRVSLPNFPLTMGFDGTPDGASFVGLGPNFELNTYEVATHTTHTLVPSQGQTTSVSVPTTDGRYITWSTGTGAQNAQHQVISESDTLWVYDTQSHQRSALVSYHRQPDETTLLTFASTIQTFQGMVLWEQLQEQETNSVFRVISAELHLTNLATRADQVISTNDGGVAVVSWPQLLYGVTNVNGAVAVHLKNLQTGIEQTLPNLPNGGVASLLAAGRVYGLHAIAHDGKTASVDLEELLDIGSSNARWEKESTFTDVTPGTGNTQDYVFRLNDHVIVYQAKDGVTIVGRATGQAITVKDATLTQERWLVLQMNDNSYDLVDTTKLPLLRK